MAREPVEGVAFLLNDSVQVTSGPRSGSRASVVSLVEAEPVPIYLVELAEGGDARVEGDPTCSGPSLEIFLRWADGVRRRTE